MYSWRSHQMNSHILSIHSPALALSVQIRCEFSFTPSSGLLSEYVRNSELRAKRWFQTQLLFLRSHMYHYSSHLRLSANSAESSGQLCVIFGALSLSFILYSLFYSFTVWENFLWLIKSQGLKSLVDCLEEFSRCTLSLANPQSESMSPGHITHSHTNSLSLDHCSPWLLAHSHWFVCTQS